MAFKYKLKQEVTIIVSGEVGEIIGRAEYVTGEKTYSIRYKAADGRAVEQWWNQVAIELVQ